MILLGDEDEVAAGATAAVIVSASLLLLLLLEVLIASTKVNEKAKIVMEKNGIKERPQMETVIVTV
jgi:hypothetical protein